MSIYYIEGSTHTPVAHEILLNLLVFFFYGRFDLVCPSVSRFGNPGGPTSLGLLHDAHKITFHINDAYMVW